MYHSRLRIAVRFGVVFPILLTVSGCPLPFPHVKEISPPVSGRVIDQNTLVPVPGAQVKISYLDGKSCSTVTDSDGNFRLPSKYRFYYGILFGVALNHSIPADDDIMRISTLDISASNYIPVHISSECYYDPNACFQLIHLKSLRLLK